MASSLVLKRLLLILLHVGIQVRVHLLLLHGLLHGHLLLHGLLHHWLLLHVVLHLVLHLLILQGGLGHLLDGVVRCNDSGLLEVVVDGMSSQLVCCFSSLANAAAEADDADEDGESDSGHNDSEHPAGDIALSLSSTDSVNGASEFALAGWDLAVSTICHLAQGHASVGYRGLRVVVVAIVVVVVAVAVIVLTVGPVVVGCGGRLSDEGKRGKKLTERSHISKIK